MDIHCLVSQMRPLPQRQDGTNAQVSTLKRFFELANIECETTAQMTEIPADVNANENIVSEAKRFLCRSEAKVLTVSANIARGIANRLGLYDAADLLRLHAERSFA